MQNTLYNSKNKQINTRTGCRYKRAVPEDVGHGFYDGRASQPEKGAIAPFSFAGIQVAKCD
ncbi:hypothetical protein GCM10027180_28790 [Microbulbifer echini]